MDSRVDSFTNNMKKYARVKLYLLPDHLHPSHPQDEDEDGDDEELPLNPGPIGVGERKITPVKKGHFLLNVFASLRQKYVLSSFFSVLEC